MEFSALGSPPKFVEDLPFTPRFTCELGLPGWRGAQLRADGNAHFRCTSELVIILWIIMGVLAAYVKIILASGVRAGRGSKIPASRLRCFMSVTWIRSKKEIT